MNLIFIFPDIGSNNINFSPAIINLSAYVKKSLPEINISLIHINNKFGVPFDLDIISKCVFDKKPDLVGITCTTYSYKISNDIATRLKNDGAFYPIVLGGSHATIKPDDLAESSFDAFAIGESECSLVDLCRRIMKNEDITSTPGFDFKSNLGIKRNPPAKIVNNLDEMPYPDYNIMDTGKMLGIRDGWMSVGFSRGCPYDCSFCINDILHKQFKQEQSGSYFRHRSSQNIILELNFLINTYGKKIKIFKFEDDLLMLNTDWFIKLMDMYRRKIYEPYGIPYVINARANLMNEDIIRTLSDSGCYEVQLGYETGDNNLRNKILNKRISDDQLLSAFSLSRQHGLRTLAYTMLGIPGETHNSIRTTIDLLNHMKPTLIRLTIFDPFFGTYMHEYCKKKNLFKKNNIEYGDPYSGTRLIFSDLTDEDISFYHLFFGWYLNAWAEDNSSLNTVYQTAIQKFKGIDLLSINRQIIFDYDKELSRNMLKLGMPHFRYFPNNMLYFEYINITQNTND